MSSAITIRNLPSHLSRELLEFILTANDVAWKLVVLCETEDEPDVYTLEAHVHLRSPKGFARTIAVLSECEVSDLILKPERTTLEDRDILTTAIDPPPSSSPGGKSWEVVEYVPAQKPAKEAFSVRESDEDEEHLVCFSTLGLSPELVENLNRSGFENTTPIQAMAIPSALEGCDMIGKAQTGSGKTLAFAIPIVNRFLGDAGRGIRALVLSPTRELALQIKQVFDPLVIQTGLKVAVVYGGESISDQILELMTKIDILIATPGRLLDLQERRRVRVDAAEMLVLDEADRMMDMGFMPQISKILRSFYVHPQTLLFSATFPKKMMEVAKPFLQDPIFIDAGTPDLTPLDTIAQKVIYVSPAEKDTCLFEILKHEKGPVIVFAKTKRSTEKLSQRLKAAGFSATRIHGDISQQDRTRAVQSFRDGRYQILVATDVASRGLDIEGISHVINYDLPMAPEDHLHRIGRTARAGASGKATTFITHAERRSVKQFKSVFGTEKTS